MVFRKHITVVELSSVNIPEDNTVILPYVPTVPSNPLPHVTIPTAVWSNFNSALVSGTVFSSVANIDAVYPPVAFTSDGFSDTSKVADFFDTNFVSIKRKCSKVRGQHNQRPSTHTRTPD